MKSPVARLVKGNEFKEKRGSIMSFWNVYTRLHEIAEAEGLDFMELAGGILESQEATLESLRQIKADLQGSL